MRALWCCPDCTTPNQQPGVCINILNCPALTSILEHRKKAEYFNLIKASFCGYEGRTTKACCPVDDSPEDVPEPQWTPAPPPVALPAPAECGKVQVNRDRIVGGHAATLGGFEPTPLLPSCVFTRTRKRIFAQGSWATAPSCLGNVRSAPKLSIADK